jgi:hypothetical protein
MLTVADVVSRASSGERPQAACLRRLAIFAIVAWIAPLRPSGAWAPSVPYTHNLRVGLNKCVAPALLNSYWQEANDIARHSLEKMIRKWLPAGWPVGEGRTKLVRKVYVKRPLWRRRPRGRSRPCSHRQTPNLGIPCRHRLGFGVVSDFPRRRRGEQMCDRQEPLLGTLERKRPKETDQPRCRRWVNLAVPPLHC